MLAMARFLNCEPVFESDKHLLTTFHQAICHYKYIRLVTDATKIMEARKISQYAHPTLASVTGCYREIRDANVLFFYCESIRS